MQTHLSPNRSHVLLNVQLLLNGHQPVLPGRAGGEGPPRAGRGQQQRRRHVEDQLPAQLRLREQTGDRHADDYCDAGAWKCENELDGEINNVY